MSVSWEQEAVGGKARIESFRLGVQCTLLLAQHPELRIADGTLSGLEAGQRLARRVPEGLAGCLRAPHSLYMSEI